jgi:3-hydroxybutyryl-CoA dehydrogenase
MASEVKSIAVIGAGTMGSGIALTAAISGIRSYQIDISPEQIDKARAYHSKTIARNVEKQRTTQADADAALKLISYHASMKDAAGVDFAIEAVAENVELKKKVFRQMLETFREDAVLATNTSSISITEIARSVDVAASRVIGFHTFNPVPVMKLIEIIRGLQTSNVVTQIATGLAKRMGKTPIVVNDRAGFVSNRVLMPMINEAFYAWMEGVAQPGDIDEVMKLGCNFPMGPLRLADFIGLDICHDILMVLWRELGQPKYAPCPLLRQLVQAGRLGDKTGRGVFDYSAK